jgi:hypothetical protein
VPPDGNCLFNSLDLLIRDRLDGHGVGRGELRQWLAGELAEDLRRYREGWGEGAPPRWAELLSYDAGDEGLAGQHDEWVRQVMADGVWDEQVGDLWPRMVAELTGPLIVLQPGLPPVRLGAGGGEPRYLIRAGNHYTPAWAPGTAAAGLAQPLPSWNAGALDGNWLTPYQVAWLRLSGRQVAPPGVRATAPERLFAVLADRAGERAAALLGRDPSPGELLRELVAVRLVADLSLGGDSLYRGLLPGNEAHVVTERIWTGSSWDDSTAALALMIAADLLDRPVTVTGPDAASSAAHGLGRPGEPVELLLETGGQGWYLLVEPLPAEPLPAEPGGGWRSMEAGAEAQRYP